MARSPELQAEIDAVIERLRSGLVPEPPEHVLEPEGATSPGLVYCMRCGYLIRSPRGDAGGASKPCRAVQIGLRAWPPVQWISDPS